MKLLPNLHIRHGQASPDADQGLPEELHGEELVETLLTDRQRRSRRAKIIGGAALALTLTGGVVLAAVQPSKEAGVAEPVPATAGAFTTTQPAPTTKTPARGGGNFQPANANLCNVLSYQEVAKAILNIPGVTNVPCAQVSSGEYMASGVWTPDTAQVGLIQSITITEYDDHGPNDVSRFDARRVNPHTDEQIDGMPAAFYPDSNTTIVRLANGQTAVDLSVQITLGGYVDSNPANDTPEELESYRKAGMDEIQALMPYFPA